MPEFTESLLYPLTLTGKRNGRYKQVVGHVTVLDDPFTRSTLARKRWQRTKDGYAVTSGWVTGGRARRGLLHRVVFEHYYGPVPVGHEIDHIDRDKSNNLPWNLRAVTRSVNMANKGPDRDNTSGFKGVSWDRRRLLWVANVRVNGRKTYLGAFADKRQAARMVNAVYRECFPEVSIPNPEAELRSQL